MFFISFFVLIALFYQKKMLLTKVNKTSHKIDLLSNALMVVLYN